MCQFLHKHIMHHLASHSLKSKVSHKIFLFQKWPDVKFTTQLAYTTLVQISRKWQISSNKRIRCSRNRWQSCRPR